MCVCVCICVYIDRSIYTYLSIDQYIRICLDLSIYLSIYMYYIDRCTIYICCICTPFPCFFLPFQAVALSPNLVFAPTKQINSLRRYLQPEPSCLL